MSIIHQTNVSHNEAHRDDSFESMQPREQFLRTLVWIIFLLLAVIMRSMWTGFSLQ